MRITNKFNVSHREPVRARRSPFATIRRLLRHCVSRNDLLIVVFVLISLSSVYAIEIPLGQTSVTGEKESSNIAYIDIERIFAEHPMTKRMQGDFKADVEKRKQEISDMESSIASLQKVIISTTTEITNITTAIERLKNPLAPVVSTSMPVSPAETPAVSTAAPAIPLAQTAVSTAAVSPATLPGVVPAVASLAELEKAKREKEAGIEVIKQEIAKIKIDISAKVRQNREELTKLEARQTEEVLADIYHILERIAKDDNLTIIIDKNNVLYGKSGQDVTERVLERLRGR